MTKKQKRKIKNLFINIISYTLIILIIATIVFGLLCFINFMSFLITWETARTSIIIISLIGSIIFLIQEFRKEE